MSPPSPPPDTPVAPDAPDAPRRRLIGIAPLVATLAARPVWGTQCISPSQTLSGAMSHRVQKVGDCAGLPAQFYLDNPQSWGLAYPLPDTPFYNVFFRPTGASLFVHPGGTSFTFLEVLGAHQNGQPDPSNIGFHITAAYLNIAAGLVDVRAMDAVQLGQMWAEYASFGFYRPFPWNPSVQWTAADIQAYLVNNALAP